jgi:predicted GNAT family N-acyltransferase
MKEGIRFAETSEELRAAYQLRYKVYVEGMGRLGDKADHNSKELHDEYDNTAKALIAIKDGVPVGTLRLIWGGDAPFSQSMIKAYRLAPFLKQLEENQICVVERLMISEKHRGSMIALRMYVEVMNFVLNHQAEIILLDCEPHRLDSYRKLGFRPFTEPYVKPGIGLVIRMVLIAGDYEHLKCVGSPFAKLIGQEDLSHCRYVNKLQELVDHESMAFNHSIFNKIECFQHYYEVKNKLYDKITTISDSRLKMKLNAYA